MKELHGTVYGRTIIANNITDLKRKASRIATEMKKQEFEKEMLKEIDNKINTFYVLFADNMQEYEEIAKTYKGITKIVKERARQLNLDLHN